MSVRIVTDSGADLSPPLAAGLRITVVPLYVRFGKDAYRDGVDISHEDLYRKLGATQAPPATSQPSPHDFARVYRKVSKGADGIVSIHVAGRLSGTYDAALRASKLVDLGCPIEVIDSRSVSMGLGLITIAAARLALTGEDLDTVLAGVRDAIPNTRMLGVFGTLKYLLAGGRIGKAGALMGSVLNVTPLVTLRDGEFFPAGQTRTRARGIERLVDFVRDALDTEEAAIVHSTTPDEAGRLRDRLASFMDRGRIHLSRLGPALGVHSGPGTLAIMLRQGAAAGHIRPPAPGGAEARSLAAGS